MKKITLTMALIAALFAVFTCGVYAQDTYFVQDYAGSVSAGYWLPTITGNIVSGTNNLDQIDFKNDLGINNNGGITADYRYKFNDTSSMYIAYFGLTNTGSRVSTRNFQWRNSWFLAGENVNSTIDIKMVDLIFEKKAYETDTAYLCWTVGVKYGGMRVALNNTTRNFTVQTTPRGLIPEIGLFGKTKMTQNLNGIGRINFIKGTTGGNLEGSMLDLSAGLTWDFYTNWSTDLCYRWFYLSGKNTTSLDQINANYGGPYLGFRYSY